MSRGAERWAGWISIMSGAPWSASAGHRQRVVADARAAGVHGAEVLEADRQAERLGGAGEPAQAALLLHRLEAAPREVERVVDEVPRPDRVRVLEEPLERAVVARAAELEAGRAVHDDPQRRDLERALQRARMTHAVARVGEHLDGRRGDLDPAEPGRLEALQRGRGGPPLIRDVESQPLLEGGTGAPRRDGGRRGARVLWIRHPSRVSPGAICEKLCSGDQDVNRALTARPAPLIHPPIRGFI